MEEKKLKFVIRPAKEEEWENAMGLAWRTFLRFEAPVYSKEGVESFLDFISDSTLKRMFQIGRYKLFVALEEETIVGLISLRECNHISLLFVDEKHHKQGIGRQLIRYAAQYLVAQVQVSDCTVNAAPYAVGFYHRVGFRDVRPEETKDGICYTPMILQLNSSI